MIHERALASPRHNGYGHDREGRDSEMTAVQEFQRLEAEGLYTSEPGAQRRDVVIALGDATLTIIDHRAVALAHWSLAAVERVNPGVEPAIFAPGAGSLEQLETDNREMIRAVEKVLAAVDRDRPHPGRLRGRLLLLGLLALLALAIFWLPGAVVRYTASVVPWPARVAIGESLIEQVERFAGPACNDPSGLAALGDLGRRILPMPERSRVRIVRDGVAGAAHFPGGQILVGRSVVEDHETPDVIAGYLLVEAVKAETADPLLTLLDYVGLWPTLTLMTTGALPDGALGGYAESHLGTPMTDVPVTALVPRFAEAQVPTTPYALAVDITGEETLPLIEADPLAGQTPPELMEDGAWIALQGICGA